MAESKAVKYDDRFGLVFDYINDHLSEDLSVDHLSRVANFSKFHFHRQFSLYAGISVCRYIQLMRLRRASYQLAFEDDTRVIDIALEAGFENPESFSRAFKQAFGQTPTQFRQDPAWEPWNQQYRFPIRTRTANMQVKIVHFPETRVAALEHIGPPETVNDTAKRFMQWRKETGLSPVKTSATYGLAHDDPALAAPEQFRFEVCGTVGAEVPENPQGVRNKVIPAGRCAVVRHFGSHDRIGDGAYFLYREWLPESGEELRDFPLFFHYLNLMPETPEHELVTDLYLPLRD
ncbi:AraC family transcriptional regulator [Alloalcanivorax xenomutans]|jgi:AraC family transcriptional regulator|uniref:AraC family transcriptional regulator n=1 Tax=Alloalcanivorax xenomutans TaxID=1094342 RepID=UPI0003B8C0FE|nr:AraC family transcriptional regulator [Alloalcanivorax xenomutans]ERS14235.1 AraC family transcriptional regulator [Alcanivorax sp. PN-3]KYZ85388.1 AraC family transcriptional regulator [Alcanivorax sp. KX64203]MBA4722329.1 AraC family transcriptional regulator [Alcanivorax sp.]ARB47337.1 AraC family transcriptional regulator [Alloalcanivorax xenomutans]MCE7525597.1 AraC family transcriptional regulator [Alloalcanivorax xenomutans]